ncbi:uncharacterized protein LOC128896502 [Hylaeus anthracinus]|uniref:uncharacterized protein LOC128879639 n=1 Tax=Hylaeus volcanicus TaxID=313075 RepID=UPI0023B82486|nr:uncharacterized protein LOC128879639 [Hylaeus volcanicus]XP_054015851.1 uncharacterized protein LOC128896502 [Hylaeus anthracinus]
MFDKMKKIILNISIVIFVGSVVYASERSLDRSDFNCSGHAHYNVSLSAYYPDFSSDNESDYLDARMKKLRNFQDFLDGRVEFVSISMDLDSGIPYGTKVCIPELNAKFSRQIPLQARDRSHYSDAKTNSPDFSHVEICVRSEEDTYDNSVNGLVTLYI